MEKFTRSRRAARAEDVGECGLDFLTKEERILDLRSVQAGGEREDDVLVDWSVVFASCSCLFSLKDG